MQQLQILADMKTRQDLHGGSDLWPNITYSAPDIDMVGVGLDEKLGEIFWKNKTEVETIADMDKCLQDKSCLDKCRGDSCYLLYMFPWPFV